jgi:hypothetical protein
VQYGRLSANGAKGLKYFTFVGHMGMWEMGISIFSESQSLKELSKHFKDHE